MGGGKIEKTSEERLCAALKMSGSPGEYSTALLMNSAASALEELNERLLRFKAANNVMVLFIDQLLETCRTNAEKMREQRILAEELQSDLNEARQVARRLWKKHNQVWYRKCPHCHNSLRITLSEVPLD